MNIKMPLSAAIAAMVSAAAAGAVMLAPASAAPAGRSPHGSYCPKPIRLRHPESLRQLERQFGWTPAELLGLATRCWGYRKSTDWDGWTPSLSRLLDGHDGKDILRVRLPAGTRIWLP